MYEDFGELNRLELHEREYEVSVQDWAATCDAQCRAVVVLQSEMLEFDGEEGVAHNEFSSVMEPNSSSQSQRVQALRAHS